MKKIFFVTVLLVLLSGNWSFSQTKTISINFDWQEQEGNELPYFKKSGYSGNMPIYSSIEKIGSRKNFTITNLSYNSVPLENKFQKFYDKEGLPSEPKIKIDAKSSKRVWFESVAVEAIFNKNGQLHKLTSLSFDVNQSPYVSTKAGIQSFASESVLAEGSGEWYKLQITNDGVHRITASMLSEMGIDLNGLNPNSINIYGNANGMLPIQNSQKRPDDLIKNRIFIQGDSDGQFNSNDFILFYAKGPDRTFYNPVSGMQVETNIYSDFSCYYLNINSANPPARIQSAALSTNPATITVTEFEDVKHYENDLENIGRVGQRWYGEKFDEQLSQSFSFNFPNAITSSDFKISTAFLGAAPSGDANFDVFVNGTNLYNVDVGSSVSGYTVGDRTVSSNNDFSMVNDNVNVGIQFNRSLPSTEGWLDYITIQGKRALKMAGGQMVFRNPAVQGGGTIAEYEIDGSNLALQVWDVSNPTSPQAVNGNLTGQVYSFRIANDTIKEFVAFNGGQYFEPVSLGRVEYQNLHGMEQAHLLIVTHPLFLNQAERLAELHRTEDGILVNVATTDQIYNEFSGGMVDPVAIKQFAKMFYDRADIDGSLYPQNICLFGDGTYDPKNRVANNNYFVPVYEFEPSENEIAGMVADEFFAILDDNESVEEVDLLDIGVGRILASSESQATILVDKIEQYLKNGSNHFPSQGDGNGFVDGLGDWKNKVLVVADDEHNNHFPIQGEAAYDYLRINHPEINFKKLYFEAFQGEVTTGGRRYPQVNEGIDRSIDEGVLLFNYIGHGREIGLATERVVTIPMINAWENADNMTTILSATCEFTRFDDPTRLSAGEIAHLSPKGAAISLFSTVRAVYFNVNDDVVEQFYDKMLEVDGQGNIRTMGELLMVAENGAGSTDNKRAFTLFGDPALRFAVPKNKVVITEVNGHPIDSYVDTLKALDLVNMKGYIADFNGVKLNDYNGVVFPEIFDKVKSRQTLGNISAVYEFDMQENVLYKGKVSVTNGDFDFDFIVPLDIDYTIGPGKISTYSYQSNSSEAWGGDYRVKVGGVNPNAAADDQGPDVKLYMNAPDFVNGGLTDETPIFIAEVFDESGINTVGNGIGHDITVIIDENTSNQIILNNYYEADLDTYKSGKVNYKFSELAEGEHTLTFKVWDVNNNSSTATLDFVVHRQQDVEITHVLNYPNPFTTKTKFMFEHNQVAQNLETQIQIFTVSGKLVKTINEAAKTDGFRMEGIEWDGKDDFGDKIGRGVYVYKVIVTNQDGSKAEKLEKLVLL